MSTAFDTIAKTIERWLTYQQSHSPDPLSDEAHLMSPPVWPTRGVLKNWVKELRRVQTVVYETQSNQPKRWISSDPTGLYINCEVVKASDYDHLMNKVQGLIRSPATAPTTKPKAK